RQIKTGDGAGGGEEQRQIDHQHMKPALIETHDHGGQKHRGEKNHQRVRNVGGQMEKRFGFYVEGRIRAEHPGQNFYRGLDQTLGPARLLRLEAVHVHGKFGSALDVRQVEKFPAFQLRAVGEIRVLGQGVVLPAAGGVDGRAAPHASSAVEIEEGAAARAPAVFHDEVAVQENRLDAGEERIVGVEIRPARLHHADVFADAGRQEVRDGAAQEVGRGDEVRVKDSHNLPLRCFQPVLQRSGFEAFAVGAMNVDDRQARGGVAFHAGARDFAGFVGGVVEHLDVQQLAGILELGNGVDQALDDVALIEDGKLYGNLGPVFHARRNCRNVFAVDVVIVNQGVAVQAVERQNEKHDEVGNHHRQIEGIGVVHPGEGAVRDFVPVMAQGALLQRGE